VQEALTGIREQLETVRRMKVQLTSVVTTTGEVQATLDRLRENVLAQVARAERELVAASVAQG
jgi:hypothetical protein